MPESHKSALHARCAVLLARMRGLEWSYRIEPHREKLIQMRAYQAELSNLNRAIGGR